MIIKQANSQLLLTTERELVRYSLTTGENERIPMPEIVKNAQSVNCMAISQDEEFIGISTDDKLIHIYNTRQQQFSSSIHLNRQASKIIFNHNNDVIVADKTGDVFLYNVTNPTTPILLFGHLSIILDMVLSDCGKYIITSDRDEKIRITKFPNTYNIVSYCLGHTEFVTNLAIVDVDILLSASGDGTLRLWNFHTGEQLDIVNTNQHLPKADLMENFQKEMAEDKIHINALPITSMQTYKHKNNTFATVTLHNFNKIQLYIVKNSTLTYVNNIDTELALNYTYTLGENLIIWDNLSIIQYKLINNHYVLVDVDENLQKLHEKYKFPTLNKNITMLYKRKFDNVQEYFERKKQRLEIKPL